jgi:hypothetical protein
MLAVLLVGCALRVGTPPVEVAYGVGAVQAAVAEPGIDALVSAGLVSALVARGAYDAAGPAVTATVVAADLSPTRRAGDTLMYELRLVVRFEAAGAAWTATRTRLMADPGSAGTARAAREAALASLARQVTEDGVSWLLSP